MTPRVAVHTVRADEPVSRVVDMLDTGHSRFPVVGEDVDDLVGVVGLAELLTIDPEQRATIRIGQIAAPAVLVPESLPLPAVLERLRAEHRQLACVVDEFGGFAGVVSLEDLAEELVGEILDEDDPEGDAVSQQADGSWAVPGRLRIDEIADATGIALPERDDYDTVSGLVMHQLGRIARPGDRVELTLVIPSPEGPPQKQIAVIEVTAVAHHVPSTVRLHTQPAHTDQGSRQRDEVKGR